LSAVAADVAADVSAAASAPALDSAEISCAGEDPARRTVKRTTRNQNGTVQPADRPGQIEVREHLFIRFIVNTLVNKRITRRQSGRGHGSKDTCIDLVAQHVTPQHNFTAHNFTAHGMVCG
jgi:hypothetical protein